MDSSTLRSSNVLIDRNRCHADRDAPGALGELSNPPTTYHIHWDRIIRCLLGCGHTSEGVLLSYITTNNNRYRDTG